MGGGGGPESPRLKKIRSRELREENAKTITGGGKLPLTLASGHHSFLGEQTVSLQCLRMWLVNYVFHSPTFCVMGCACACVFVFVW